MSRGQKAVYIILAAIPVLFILFLLAMVNVLLMLAGVVLVLGALLLIKQKNPDLFSFGKKAEEEHKPSLTDRPEIKPAKPQVYMVLTGREDFGARRIIVNKTSYSIGRGVDNDFVIDGAQISRHHLKIEYNSVENVCYAIDTGSANGTFLNTERMVEGRRYRLIQGDRIMIDDRAFVVEYAHY